MIIGNGLIANGLKEIDNDDFIFFASGVSDSVLSDAKEFTREKNLLLKTIKENKFKKIIYFSTCDFYDSSKQNSLYLKHKFDMENVIKNNSKNWIIFRISQVIGNNGNKNNLLYKLCSNIIYKHNFLLYPNYERNLISIDDLKEIILIYLPLFNKIINIANPLNIKVGEIVEIIERSTNKKGIYTIINDKNLFKISLDIFYPYNLFNSNYYKESINSFLQKFN
jgi:nucleoside-diphosphate-sugar epimerase